MRFGCLIIALHVVVEDTFHLLVNGHIIGNVIRIFFMKIRGIEIFNPIIKQ
jgi:hypothetical protein